MVVYNWHLHGRGWGCKRFEMITGNSNFCGGGDRLVALADIYNGRKVPE